MNIKLYFFTFLFLTAVTGVFGQEKKVKIKFKGDKITANNIDVAKVVEIDEDMMLFAIEDLSGNKILDVKVNNSGATYDLNKNNWMTVTSPDSKTVNVLDYDMVGMSTNPMNTIGLSLGRNFNLFTESGINQDGLKKFLKVAKTSQNKEIRTGYGGPEIKGYGNGFDGKIKIKNNLVSFDKKDIAKLIVTDSLFAYSSLDGSTALNVIYHDYTIYGERENKRFRWLELSDDSGHSSDIRMEYILNFGDDSKQISLLLAKAYNLLTVSGIANLDSFFAIQRPSLSDAYKEAKAEYDQMIAEMKAIIDERRPLYKLSETGEVTRTIDDAYLGRIILPKSLDMIKESTTVIQVGERADKKILELTPVGYQEFYANFYGDDYYFRSTSTNLSSDTNKQNLRSEILNFIIAKKKDSVLNLGYEEYKAIKLTQAIKKYKARKLISPNIYGKPGYVIDDEGEKWEGKVSINFEELIDPEKNESAVFKNVVEIGGNPKYGKEVQIEYINEKGKTKSKVFKSSRETEFYITDGMEEIVYKGFKTNVDGFDAALSATTLNFNYSSFYLILSESEEIVGFKNPLTNSKGIKTKVQDRGFNFITSNPERNFEKLKKYLEDCSSLPDTFKNLDYTKPESVNNLIEYYKSSCK